MDGGLATSAGFAQRHAERAGGWWGWARRAGCARPKMGDEAVRLTEAGPAAV